MDLLDKKADKLYVACFEILAKSNQLPQADEFLKQCRREYLHSQKLIEAGAERAKELNVLLAKGE